MADRNLSIKLTARNEAAAALREMHGQLGGLQQAAQSLVGFGLNPVGLAIATVVATMGEAIHAASAMQNATTQLHAVLRSTTSAAGVTAESALELADSFSKVAPFERTAIIGAENLLLTFREIGHDIFPQATEAVLNMSSALGEDLHAAAIQLGKALQDPITGITALRRVGVSFSESQKEVIKKLAETGHLAEAQAMILKELDIEFGGTARAAGTTLTGQLAILGNKLKEDAETIGTLLIPALLGAVSALEKVGSVGISAFQSFTRSVVEAASSAQNLYDIVRQLAGFQPTAGIEAAQRAFGPSIPAPILADPQKLIAFMAAQEAMRKALAETGASSKITGEQLAAMSKILAPQMAEAAEKAKTALELLGISEHTVRAAMDMLGLSAETQRAVLLALGVEAINAGPILEGLGVTVDKLAAAFNAAGLNGAALSAQVAGIIAQEKAEAEAAKEAAKAEREAAEAARAAAEARQQALSTILGTAGRNLAGVALRTPEDALRNLGLGVSVLQEMAKAGQDLTVPLTLIDQSLSGLSAQLAQLGGLDLAAAGAVMQGLRDLWTALMTGTIGAEEFAEGVGKLQSALGDLVRKVEEAAEAQKRFWDAFNARETERLENNWRDYLRDKEAAFENQLAAERAAQKLHNEQMLKLWQDYNNALSTNIMALAGTGSITGNIEYILMPNGVSVPHIIGQPLPPGVARGANAGSARAEGAPAGAGSGDVVLVVNSRELGRANADTLRDGLNMARVGAS